MSKGILGFGDSFMWGESIYFYSELDNLPFGERHEYHSSLITEGMSQYKNKYRYIQLVCDYFDTWCNVKNVNGSNNTSNLEIISKFYNRDIVYEDKYHFKLNINDYKLIIFQFTSIYRDDKNINDLLIELDSYFNKFENNGIKVITLTWMSEIYNNDIYQTKYLDRHTNIVINEIEHTSFEELIHNDSLNITVKSDFEKNNLQTNDIHLNHKGNQCFADSIIKKLENDNFKI